jgi:hypothetical protein
MRENEMDQASELANTIAVRMSAYSADDKDSSDEIAFEIRKKDSEIDSLKALVSEMILKAEPFAEVISRLNVKGMRDRDGFEIVVSVRQASALLQSVRKAKETVGTR